MRSSVAIVWFIAVTACSVSPVTFTPDEPNKPAPTCTDGAKNGDETDVDCGGACGPCSDGASCSAAGDCTSGVCNVTCQVATCSDGVKNGDETAKDCGGGCAPCADGLACDGNADCASSVCSNATCLAASCMDGVKNGSETARDCGGACAPCDDGLACAVGGDCASKVCNVTCQAATCSDNVQNGSETAKDCGGLCNSCADGLTCGTDGDCTSQVCNVTCQAATCSDGKKNGAETDVDCGGSTCGRCNFTQACRADTDCASAGICDNLICRPGISCAEILAHSPRSVDGFYPIQPVGVTARYQALCDMANGGWTLLLKSNGDATFAYAAAAWTDTSLLSPDDGLASPNNAKYPAFLSMPVTTLRGDLDGFVYTKDVAAATALQIFSGAAQIVDSFPTFGTGANWSAQPNCHTFGINIPYPTRARFGWSANQENDCITNDTGIGLGTNSFGAGYQCGSSECSLGNVAASGHGLLWGR